MGKSNPLYYDKEYQIQGCMWWETQVLYHLIKYHDQERLPRLHNWWPWARPKGANRYSWTYKIWKCWKCPKCPSATISMILQNKVLSPWKKSLLLSLLLNTKARRRSAFFPVILWMVFCIPLNRQFVKIYPSQDMVTLRKRTRNFMKLFLGIDVLVFF